ncbi:MAG: phosphonopyruvate decarboxylase [Acetobacteraceae bacterium]
MSGESEQNWPDAVFQALKGAQVRQVGYVPDAGHARLIARAEADPELRVVVLTTEEEGVALAAGAWLGGERAALLMQSSGVGNCINMLSLITNCRMPFLSLITMRGEWGEFNPWQVPMGSATPQVLGAMGVQVLRAERAGDAAETVRAAAALAFDSAVPVAVLFSQRLIGAKEFRK